MLRFAMNGWSRCAVVLLAACVSLGLANRSTAAERPNVLFVVVDDLRPELECYDRDEVESPNVDRLADRAVRFDQAYCQYPVCNPSRTSFLTGLRPETTGVLTNELYFREKLPDVVTLPELFRKQGYRTISLGKVFHTGGKKHMLDDAERSWTEAKMFTATKLGQQGEERELPNPGGTRNWCRWLAADGDDEDQPDGQAAAAAVRIMSAKSDAPWFLAVGFLKPHDPFNAPKKYFDLYPIEQVTLHHPPANRTPDLPVALGPGLDFSKFSDRDRLEFKRAYLAGISFMDAQLGKLLDVLDEQQQWNNTIVVFIGDHGYHLGEHSWWNKSTVFEESARVPLLVWAPGMEPIAKMSPALVELVDLYPTLCDLCRIEPPSGLEGLSFRPVLREPNRPWKKGAFTVVTRRNYLGRTVRTDRWRYTEWDEGRGGVELYDQLGDSDDYHNLAADPQHAATVAQLRELLKGGWRAALPQ